MKNKLIKVLSLVMALTMLAGAFGTVSFAADCDHANATVEVVEPTCNEWGMTWHKCPDCGKKWADNLVPESEEHTGLTEVEATAPTCTKPGYTAGVYCADCGVAEDGTITWLEGHEAIADAPALGHDFKNNYVTVDPTCTENGSVTFVCKRCEITYEEALAAGETTANPDYAKHTIAAVGAHAWVVTGITAPTTCVDGKIDEACSACDATRTTVIKATHDYEAFTNPVLVGCVEYASGEKCSICKAYNPVGLVPNTNKTDAHNFEKVTAINNDLIAMGYTSNSSLEKAATCTTDGWYVARCSECGTYEKLVGEAAGTSYKAGHTWGQYQKVYGADETADKGYCAPSYNSVRTCTVSGCTAKETFVIRPAVEHTVKTSVKAGTCTAFGETYDYCANPNCQGTDKEVVWIDADNDGVNDNTVEYHVLTGKVATPSLGGHTWGASTTPTADYVCTDGFTSMRKCTVCDYEEEDTDKSITATQGHTYTTGSLVKVIPATCTTPAYNAYYCTNPYCSATTPAEYNADDSVKYINSTKDASNHVYTLTLTSTASERSVAVANGTLVAVTKNATCSAKGTVKLICACTAELNVDFGPFEHVESAEGAVFYYNGTNYSFTSTSGYTKKDCQAVATTCVAAGKTAATACLYCGVYIKAPQNVALDPDAHTFTTAPVDSKAATCQEYAYTSTYCQKCQKIIKVFDVDGGYGDCNVVSVAPVAPTCGTAGKHYYTQCDVCKDVKSVVYTDFTGATPTPCADCLSSADGYCTNPEHIKFAFEMNYVADALAHDYVDVDGQDETCDAAGFTAYKQCSVCQVITGKSIIPAHGDKYVEEIVPVAATCTTTGIALKDSTLTKVNACTKCDKKSGDSDTDYVYEVTSALNHPGMGATTSISFVNADNEPVLNPANNCTLPTVVVSACPLCGYIEASNYAVGAENHNFELNWHKVAIKEGTNEVWDGATYVGLSCTEATYEYRACTVCGFRDVRNEVAPLAHYYKDGDTKVEISLSCADIEEFVGRKCEICGLEVALNGAAGTLSVSHSFEEYEQAATCTTAGFTGKLCSVCGETKDLVPVPAFNPTLVPFVVDANGDFNKANPTINDTVVSKVLVHNAATTAADGYIKYICAICDETHEYTYDAINAAEFYFNVDKTVATVGDQIVVTIYVTADNYTFQNVNMQIRHNSGLKLAENGIAVAYDFGDVLVDKRGNTDVTNAATAVTTVLLWATTGADGKVQTATLTGEETAVITLTFDVLSNAYGKAFDDNIVKFDASYVNNEGNEVKNTVITEVDEDFTKAGLAIKGDSNGDNKLDVADVNAIIEAVYAQSADKNLDFNNDGIVDIDDHFAFLNLYTSFAPTLYDYYTLLGVDLRAYVDALVITIDLNGDRIIDAGDADVVYTKVLNQLNSVSFYTALSSGLANIDYMVEYMYQSLVSGSIH